MGWTGKVFGAGIGSFFGGSWGAVAGAVIGHYLFDREKKQDEPNDLNGAEEDEENNQGMLILSGAVFHQLAFLEGTPPAKVQRAALEVLSELNEQYRLHATPSQLASAFNSPGVDQPQRQLIQLATRLPNPFKLYFYGWLIRISVADGVQSDAEKSYIQTILNAFQIDREVSAFISRLYLKPFSARTETADVKEAAALLQVSSNADCSELKRAYRKQCMIYHPDHLGNVAPEIRALASERFKKITDAYELLAGLSGEGGEQLWALDPDTGRPSRVHSGMVIRCLCCGAKIRIPDPFNPARARCPKCQALLAFEEEFIANWLEVHNS